MKAKPKFRVGDKVVITKLDGSVVKVDKYTLLIDYCPPMANVLVYKDEVRKIGPRPKKRKRK